jgi:hypothetical protein
MSQHRGAKQFHRYGLSENISLLSPTYLLFVDRWLFHTKPPGHYVRLSSLLNLLVLQSGDGMYHYAHHMKYSWHVEPHLKCALVTLWKAAAPAKLPTLQNWQHLRCCRGSTSFEGWYSHLSLKLNLHWIEQAPTYAAHQIVVTIVKL